MLNKTLRLSLLKRLKRHKIVLSVLLLVVLVWCFSLPRTLFNKSTATVVSSSTGALLGARIASDGQWRFPEVDEVPERFKTCIIAFEDAYFYKHPGFNPVAMSKALWSNLTKESRRGGSTLTQQVIRLSRDNPNRTYLEKLIETFLATRLEAGLIAPAGISSSARIA